MLRRASRVFLYDSAQTWGLDIFELSEFLKQTCPWLEVHTRKDFVPHHSPDTAVDLLPARIADLSWQGAPSEELAWEHRWLSVPREPPFEAGFERIYDAFRLQAIYARLIPPSEAALSDLHIAFTEELIGTYDLADEQFHLRVIALGRPTIISTSGLIEAPAKPREYYFVQMQLQATGLVTQEDLDDLEEEFSDRCLSYGDERLNLALRGYLLMALFYRMTGEGMCDDPQCRLYDAHWQEELIAAQCHDRLGLCPRHEAILNEARRRFASP